jgi:hypothetical protein
MTDLGRPPRSPRRLSRVAWRIGWGLLALASFCVTYVLLVMGGH